MKRFIIFVLILAYASAGFSQDKEKKSPRQTTQNPTSVMQMDYNSTRGKRVVVGICLGPSVNWMNWKNHKAAPAGYDRAGAVLGLRYGIPVDIDLTKEKHFFFSTGILIEHSGGKLEFNENKPLGNDTIPNTFITRTYKSIYLTIPTAITLKTPAFDNFVIGGNIGFYHSFLVFNQISDHFVDKEVGYTTDREESPEGAFIKESAFIGLGFEYVIKKNFKAKFYVNYVQSFNNYFKGKGKAVNNMTGVQEKASIGSIEFLFGFSF